MSLRFRLLAIVVAAALAPMAPLAIALLLQVRDAVYARSVADGRARLAAAAASARSCGADRACMQSVARGAGMQLAPPPCPPRQGHELTLCEEIAPGLSLQLRADLSAVQSQLDRLDARLLLTLVFFLALMVIVAVWLLERGVVRRLSQVDAALEVVGAEQESQLLPEGGDAVGRVGAAVNRLAQRLREERVRTRTQIEELRAAREEVLRAQRLASVGRLAAGVAHEVGNPVAALLGYAALMRERLGQGKDVSEYAERVEREAARIDRIVRDLLDLARPPAQLLPVDLRRAVEFARMSVEGLQVEVDLPAELPKVKGEEHYLAQLFVNLFSNAQRAGAGRVRVSGTPQRLLIEDDGRGIPPEALPRLFEPFFTTAAPGQGTGLGLALCHATMERIGGSISARNGERGAVFELSFAAA
ncbi:MAG TPA: ATP-binding protein [Myxococcales bacterium]|nr:ATP-binding protein [Myxococcales bacterium]